MNKSLLVVITLGIISVVGGVFFYISRPRIDTTADTEISSIVIDGSSTIYPIFTKIAPIFMKKNPDIKIEVRESGSGEGIKKFINKKIDIATSSRPVTDSEIKDAEANGLNLQVTTIANDALIIIVNKENPISVVTLDQLDQIFFTGKINNWSQIVPTKKGPIVLYGGDPKKSGSATFFIDSVHKGGTFVSTYNGLDLSSTTVDKISADPNGIGYTSMEFANTPGVKILENPPGVPPTKETILNSSYRFSRKLYLITDGTPKGATLSFITFLLTQESQKIIEDLGFIPVN